MYFKPSSLKFVLIGLTKDGEFVARGLHGAGLQLGDSTKKFRESRVISVHSQQHFCWCCPFELRLLETEPKLN